MTARGAVLAMFSLFFLGTLIAGWLHLELLAGLSFVVGCALAASYTRRDALLTVVTTPPLIFVVVLIGTVSMTSHADTVRHTLTSTAEGIVLALAAVAPWLFIGVFIGLIIALLRGLPQCVRDLSAELRGGYGLRGPSAPWPRAPQRGAPAQPDPRDTDGR
jgi:uncharacterized membrane protein YraQ (UPF0718 family)